MTPDAVITAPDAPGHLFTAWLLIATLGVPVLLYRLACHAGHGSRPGMIRCGVLVVALAWAHPFTQWFLAAEAAFARADALQAYVGRPLADVVARYGPPLDAPPMTVYPSRPWFAPLPVHDEPEVRLHCFAPGVLGHVYADG